jgi:exopolysaccharide biosynthesis polyprenyl glycosylphosphotransferase
MGESHAVLAEGTEAVAAPQREALGVAQPRPGIRLRRPRLDAVASLEPKAPSRRDSLRRRMLAGGDVLAILLAYAVVWAVAAPPTSLTSRAVLLGELPFWILLNKLLGLYDRDANVMNKSTLDELPRIAHSAVLGSAAAFLLVPLVPGVAVYRTQTILFIVALLVTMPAVRCAVRALFSRYAEPERVLIVGSGEVARLLAGKLAKHPEYRVDLVGFVDNAWPGADVPGNGRVPPTVGGVEEFERLCHELEVERVVIAFSSLSHEDLLAVVRMAKQLNLKVTVVPRLFEGIGDAVEIEQVEGLTLLGLRGLSRTRSSLRLKRAFDVAVAVSALVVLAPLLALIALLVKLDSHGPVFFRQQRVGAGDEPFTMLKFRSMFDGADALKASLRPLNEVEGPMFKIARDPRVTRVGRWLRRFSLDELPQLWNVVRGDMSLVGPRPLVPEEAEQVIGRHRARLDLTPGVTGPWQVMGRNAISFAEMVKLDYLYVAEWSLWNDVKLLLRTAPVVAGGGGR